MISGACVETRGNVKGLLVFIIRGNRIHEMLIKWLLYMYYGSCNRNWIYLHRTGVMVSHRQLIQVAWHVRPRNRYEQESITMRTVSLLASRSGGPCEHTVAEVRVWHSKNGESHPYAAAFRCFELS